MRNLIFENFIKAIKNIFNIYRQLIIINDKLNFIENRLYKLEDRVDSIYDLLLQIINKK